MFLTGLHLRTYFLFNLLYLVFWNRCCIFLFHSFFFQFTLSSLLKYMLHLFLSFIFFNSFYLVFWNKCCIFLLHSFDGKWYNWHEVGSNLSLIRTLISVSNLDSKLVKSTRRVFFLNFVALSQYMNLNEEL